MDRRFPIVPFDATQFAPYFGDQAADMRVELLSGGACNSNYLARLPGGTPYICRMHTRGNPALEHYITTLVTDGTAAIPTPRYLWTGDHVSVMSYIEGDRFHPTPALVREAGRIIGRLAKVQLDRPGQISPDGTISPFKDWPSFCAGLNAMLNHTVVRQYLNAATTALLRDLLTRTRPIWRDFETFHNLVHGDFNPGNILVSGDTITGVLDWEFTHSGCSYMDIGNLLRHVGPAWENDLARGLTDEDFPLPDDWPRRARLIDLCSHLEFLTSQRSHNFKLACVQRIRNLADNSC